MSTKNIASILPAMLVSLLMLGGAPANADTPAPTDWPHAQDIPAPEPVAPGLAGETPPDIVRFLLTRSTDAPALSPDGETLAFRTDVTGLPQLWRVPARGGWPQQLTFGPAVTFHAWLPDGSGLIYAADRQGDEREAYWFISADGTREREILPFDGAFREFGDLNDDSTQLAYSSTLRNGADFDVYVAELATGESRLVYEGRFGYYADSWQPGGRLLLVRETRGEDGNDLHLLDTGTGELQTLFAPEAHAYYDDIAWRPEGRGFYLITDHEREFRAIAYYELASGELRLVEAADGLDIDDLALSPDGRKLVWTINDGSYSRLRGRDLLSGEPLAAPRLPDGVYSLSFADDAAVLAISVRGPRDPGSIWTWDLRSGHVAEAAPAELAGIPRSTLISPESVSFAASDGVMLHGLLYLPDAASVSGERPPLVINVHGGPTSQARPDFDAVFQYLLGRGIAVLDLNFRGSSGFGKTFTRLDNRLLRPDAVRDLVDALDFLAADGRVDAGRSAVMGASYGGYLVNDVLARYPEAFAAGVSLAGVSDWIRALEEASPALQASDRIEYGDITDAEMRKFFRELSTLTRVDRIQAPMLFSHGANDPRNPVTESDQMVLALRARGIEAEYLRFPDEGHAVRRLENRVELYRRVAAFLEQHLASEHQTIHAAGEH